MSQAKRPTLPNVPTGSTVEADVSFEEDEIAPRTVNATGLAEIHRFLAENHRLGGDHFGQKELAAWAADAEFQMAEGNAPTIEIRDADSVRGCTQTYTVSDAGIDGGAA